QWIELLANRHNIAPKGDTPWLKAVIGGSDDHSGINPGQTWTTFACNGSPTPNGLIDAIRARAVAPAGAHGGPITIAHSVLKLLYEGGQRQVRNGRPARAQGEGANAPSKAMGVGSSFQALLRQVFDAGQLTLRERLAFKVRAVRHQIAARHNGLLRAQPFEAVLDARIHAMLRDGDFRAALAAAPDTDARIFLVIKTLVHQLFVHYAHTLRAAGAEGLIPAIRESAALVCSQVFVSLPYVLAFTQQSNDGRIARDVRRAFRLREKQRLVLITDTYFDVNGVSNTIRRMIREAIRRDIDFTVMTCIDAEPAKRPALDEESQRFVDLGRLRLLPAIATMDFPQYDGLKVHIPPFLDLLRELQEGGYTKMQISTPGIVGVAGLAAAKLLQIETAATYHTSFPEYVENYTGDVSLEALAWKYMVMFYHAVDETIVPSRYVARQLHERGLRNKKLLILDRWVDVSRFDPRHRDAGYWPARGIAQDTLKYVYVGRLAAEKGLRILAQAFVQLVQARADVHLVFIGDGPDRAALQDELRGLPVTFTGFLHGGELAIALASCDVKVFPSTTDTWGNAPLEAQAAGLPVIVTDIGGPAELLDEGKTGLIVRGNDIRALYFAMLQLADTPTRERMGRAARAFAEAGRVDEPFSAILDSERYRRKMRQRE
ncbi:MAG: glycosyltransferase family 1 protein, partial [Betaproteobacteria bacterium]|nr:glycosyltransferase family 1 protein [Betaproteobacteria bacterium]